MHRKIAGSLTGPITTWVVLGVWLGILPLGFVLAGKLAEVENNEPEAWLPDTAEVTEGYERLSGIDPASENHLPTVMVYERTDGAPLSESDLAAIEADAEEFRAFDGVIADEPVRDRFGVVGPIPSEDGMVAQTVVTFDLGADGWEEMPGVVDELRDVAAADGLEVYATGVGGSAADEAEAFSGIDSTLLFAALGVVVVLLLLAYRSPVLWLLPVISALAGLFTAQGAVYLLAEYADLTVNAQTRSILSVLVIGASVDYALLLVARYREELRRHSDRHEAMAFALHRASPAIIASGLTVALGMLCLLFADMNSTSGLGPVAAVGIACGVAAMLTLLPALLVILGRWVFWPLRPRYGSHEPTSDGFWAGAGALISRGPRLVWVATAVVLGIAALGVLRIDASGLATADSYTSEMESVQGRQVLADHGLFVDANAATVVTDVEHAGAVRDAMTGVDGVAEIAEPTVHQAAGIATIDAPLTAADPATEEAYDAVRDLRAAVHGVPDADPAVIGNSALFLDINDASARDNVVVAPLILLVVLMVLIGLLRSLTAPLLLMGTVVLSFGAALGLSWLFFEFVLGHAGMNPGTPLWIFVFLVALGIDYNIFLMTRVREETPARGTREAARVALAATGGVITSAGLVLAGTFSVLLTLPMVDFVQIGFGIALGIVLDTFIVRSVLVTALNVDFGSRIWWPSALDRTREPEQRPEPALVP